MAERANNLAALQTADHEWDVYATLQQVKKLEAKNGKPFLVLELKDLDSTIEAKVWNDSKAFDAAIDATPPCVVKVRGAVKDYQGKGQLVASMLKVLQPNEVPDDVLLTDPALAGVEDLLCQTLVFDIETVPAFERRELPNTISEVLAKHAERKDMEPDAVMGLSPYFGKVVSLAIGDGEAAPGDENIHVLAVPPEGHDTAGAPAWLRYVSEAELLRSFWALASRAQTVVSFNGKGFDVPFVVARSMVHGIPARVDLLSQKFALQPHLDLWEVLGRGGAGPSKLEVICWALGIESPKDAMDGSMVAPAYARGEIEKIAEYNANDVRATCEVYRRTRDLVLRHRADWRKG